MGVEGTGERNLLEGVDGVGSDLNSVDLARGVSEVADEIT